MKSLSNAREYLQRRIHPGQPYERLLKFPRYIEIETVNACNARCPMCTIADWTRDTPMMKDDIFKKAAEEAILHKEDLERVILHRDGEPLLDRKLPRRIKFLKDGGIKKVSIATNVSLLRESVSGELLDAGLDMVIFSIDSLEKKTFEDIRVRLKFEEVIENANRFIKLRDRLRPETSIWVRMIRQKSNQHEWDHYHDYWSQRLSDNDRVYYQNVYNWGGQLKGFDPVHGSLQPQLPCVALWSLLVVLANGDVPLCNVDYNNKFPTGNILKNSIEEIWQSQIMSERRRLHLNSERAKISLCENCNVWDGSSDQPDLSAEYAGTLQK